MFRKPPRRVSHTLTGWPLFTPMKDTATYYNNALYYANSDGEIEVIIVEVDDATEFVAPASTPAP